MLTVEVTVCQVLIVWDKKVILLLEDSDRPTANGVDPCEPALSLPTRWMSPFFKALIGT